MKILIQRVSSATVKVKNKTVGKIGRGILIFLGITHDDTEKDLNFLADKSANLRIFEDDDGKMNLSLKDIKGEALVISQFTLYGDVQKGRRPSFGKAAGPNEAIPLYKLFIEKMLNNEIKTETGTFGAMMDVEIHNDGPVTIMIESKK